MNLLFTDGKTYNFDEMIENSGRNNSNSELVMKVDGEEADSNGSLSMKTIDSYVNDVTIEDYKKYLF